MVSSGYMTEVTFEGIWGATISTAQFDLINIRLGGIFNYLLTRDGATDITDTAVLIMIIEMSEEALMQILQGSKSNKFTDVWRFIQSDAVSIISKILRDNEETVKMIKQDLGSEKMEMTNTYLPSSKTRW